MQQDKVRSGLLVILKVLLVVADDVDILTVLEKHLTT